MAGDLRAQFDGAVLVAALGLVFVVAGVALWAEAVLPEVSTTHRALYELVTHVLFGGVMLVLGVTVERSELDSEERYALMAWCFGGFLLLFGLAVWAHAGSLVGGQVTAEFASQAVVFGSMGGAFGAVAGANRGRATTNRKLADRVEEQRETLVLLTRLLRHDIRNDMMAINGHADLLEDHVQPEGEDSLEVISRRSDSTVRLLEDADTLIETLDEAREHDRVDLSAVLREEVASVANSYPQVEVRSSVPDDLVVVADGLVHQLFSNLLENAVAHNDPTDLTVSVEASHDGGSVEVIVADDGDGIPDAVREDCFELGEQGAASAGDGLGLYIVSRLADVYGGTVALADHPDWGARFRVTLPAADVA